MDCASEIPCASALSESLEPSVATSRFLYMSSPRGVGVRRQAVFQNDTVRARMKRLVERLALLFVAGWASLAGAHAVLDQSIPAARSTVRVSPKEITLTFSQRLEPAFSSVRVLDADGKQV